MSWILIHFDVLLLGRNFFSPNLKVTKKVKGQAFLTVRTAARKYQIW